MLVWCAPPSPTRFHVSLLAADAAEAKGLVIEEEEEGLAAAMLGIDPSDWKVHFFHFFQVCDFFHFFGAVWCGVV